MRSFARLIGFELRLQFAGPMAWMGLVAFAGIGVYLGLADPTPVNNVTKGLFHDGAANFLVGLSGLSILGTVVAALFVGTAILRHVEHRTSDLVSTGAVTYATYLAAQFVGGFVLLAAMFAAVVAGMWISFLTPAVPAAALGPMPWRALAVIVFVHLLPNLLFSAAAALVLTTLTRSLKYAVVGALCIVVVHSVANALTIDHPWLGAIIDPYAGQAAVRAMTDWDASKLHAEAPWGGEILLNRCIWLAASIVMVMFALRAKVHQVDRVPRTNRSTPPEAAPSYARRSEATFKTVARPPSTVRAFLALLGRSLAGTLSALPFWLCTVAMAVIVGVYLVFSRSVDGTPVYPLTHYILRAVFYGSSPAYMIILGFMAGELVNNDREHRVTRITDTLPIPDTAAVASPLVAMGCLVGALNLASLLAGIVFQLASGFTDLEPMLYTQGFVLLSLPMLTFGAAAVGIQWLCANKYIGYLFTALLALVPAVLSQVGLSDHLFIFNTTPPIKYSDIGGFGPFGVAVLWFDLYWICGAMAFAWIASGFRQRSDVDVASRWRSTGPRASWGYRAPVLALVALCMATGTWIAWNTHVRNAFGAGPAPGSSHAASDPQPTVTSVDLKVDIYPKDRALRVAGSYVLTNLSQVALPTLVISWDSRTHITWRSGLGRIIANDPVAGLTIIQLQEPLAKGASLTLGFDLDYAHEGFTNEGGATDVLADGTFVTSDLMPSIGYGHGKAHASLIDFHAVVSTDRDQVALAPGKHLRSWNDHGRRVDEFASERRMVNSYGILSGCWVVTRASIGEVSVEIYASPKHPWNVPTIMEAAKDGLADFGAAYGRYPLTELRIVEFPEYRVFAQSFPGLIAYSGALGFSSRRGAEGTIDFPYFITAHELAHQWWGQMLRPADGPGSLLLTEGMAQYSAIELLRKHRPASVAAALSYLRHRYLEGAAGEVAVPTLASMTDQVYVAYNKGPLAIEAYRGLAGPDTANSTLTTFFAGRSQVDAPAVSGAEFIQALRESVAPGDRAGFDRWFLGTDLPR